MDSLEPIWKALGGVRGIEMDQRQFVDPVPTLRSNGFEEWFPNADAYTQDHFHDVQFEFMANQYVVPLKRTVLLHVKRPASEPIEMVLGIQSKYPLEGLALGPRAPASSLCHYTSLFSSAVIDPNLRTPAWIILQRWMSTELGRPPTFNIYRLTEIEDLLRGQGSLPNGLVALNLGSYTNLAVADPDTQGLWRFGSNIVDVSNRWSLRNVVSVEGHPRDAAYLDLLDHSLSMQDKEMGLFFLSRPICRSQGAVDTILLPPYNLLDHILSLLASPAMPPTFCDDRVNPAIPWRLFRLARVMRTFVTQELMHAYGVWATGTEDLDTIHLDQVFKQSLFSMNIIMVRGPIMWVPYEFVIMLGCDYVLDDSEYAIALHGHPVATKVYKPISVRDANPYYRTVSGQQVFHMEGIGFCSPHSYPARHSPNPVQTCDATFNARFPLLSTKRLMFSAPSFRL